MAKNKAQMTVMSGKTLSTLIDLQQSTQDALNKITSSMQDAADKKNDDLQNQLLIISQKILDVNLDNFKITKKTYDVENKTFESLSKGVKSWKTWGDKLDDLKGAMQDKLTPDSIQKKILKGLNIGGILNQKLMALDFKKQAKALGTAPSDKKELDKQANAFAAAQVAMMRENQKIENLKKKTGATDEQVKNSPVGSQLYSNRDQYANTVSNLMPGGKSAKDMSNTMGGNTSGISVPLTPAEARPLTDLPSGAASQENQLEQMRMQQQNADNLQRIADNTDMLAGNDQQGNKKTDDGQVTSTKGLLSGLMDSVMALFGDSFLSAITSAFSVRSLVRLVTKFFAPAMIIASLANGIMDGFQAWQQSGSLSDALIAGLGGILEFLSFGLFDKDTVENIVSGINNMIDKYIVQPISDFIDNLGDAFDVYIAQPFQVAFDSIMNFAQDLGELFTDTVITPIQNAFQPISDFFSDMMDSVVGFLKAIEIPGIAFTAPVIGDVSFGPWHPFDNNPIAADNNAQAVKPKSGQMITDASKNNADQAALVDSGRGKGDVNTQMNQVNQNSITNTTVKPSVRNQESSQQKYLAARY